MRVAGDLGSGQQANRRENTVWGLSGGGSMWGRISDPAAFAFLRATSGRCCCVDLAAGGRGSSHPSSSGRQRHRAPADLRRTTAVQTLLLGLGSVSLLRPF